MKPTIAMVKNIEKLQDALDAIINRGAGVEGMCLAYGATGTGKSTALSYFVNRYHAIYVEASPSWTLTGMLGAIIRAMGVDPKLMEGPRLTAADMEAFIVAEMMGKGRPLFIDELDHILLPGQSTTLRMLESLRSIYDKSRMPVVMVGMDKIDRKIALREQLARRIFVRVRFEDQDRGDVRQVADALCELPVADDWLDDLHTAVKGRIGYVVLNLALAERRAKGNRWDLIDRAHWKEATFITGR